MTANTEETIFKRMEMGLEIYIAWLNACNSYLHNMILFAESAKGFLDSTKKIHENYGVFKQYA